MKKTSLIITALMLVVGCGSSEKEPINYETTLIERDGVHYTKDTNKPYSGPVFSLYENGQKIDDRELFRLVLLDEQIETGYDKAPKLTLEDIYERFPMCGWGNSRGQMCKTLSEDEYLTPKDLGTAEYTDNVLTVESEDWYYEFELIDEDELSVIFTDDAKFGTYLTTETLHIRWDQDLKDWIIEGSTLNYLSGADQDRIGETTSFQSLRFVESVTQ